jgi:hypothetical protein
MTLTEITKLALIELDEKQTNTVYDSLLDNYYSGKIKSESVKNSKELRSLLDKYDK